MGVSYFIGERNPKQLATFREPGCKADEATITAALTGHWQAEYEFIIQQSLALYDAYTAQIAECDQALEQQYAACKPRWDGPDILPEVPASSPISKARTNLASTCARTCSVLPAWTWWQ